MKKLLVISLCVGLLFLIACKDNTNIPPSTPNPSIENLSITENEISSKADETPIQDQVESYQKPIVDNEQIDILILTVPLEIVRQDDNPMAYDTGKQEELLGTQNEIERYSEWISTLQGVDVSAIYGETMPIFEYTQGKMSLEDSQIIFDKIKSITQDLKPMSEEERMNPYTGGGWTIALHTQERVVTLSFNGGWFTVCMSDEKDFWIFNVDETPAQKICYDIDELLAENMNNGSAENTTIFYQGSELEHLYAINIESYVMAEITENSLITEILDDFEGRTTGNNLNGFGYLLFNSDGKQYQYLNDDDRDIALTKKCLAALTNSKLHPSWIIHMTSGRIISANIGTDLNAYTNPDAAISEKKFILTITDNKESLLALSEFLKQEVVVGGETETIKGILNPTEGSIASLDILFDSNVHYFIDVRSDSMLLYSSDLDTNILYTLNSGIAEKINGFLRELN